jgi:hypothetical protein
LLVVTQRRQGRLREVLELGIGRALRLLLEERDRLLVIDFQLVEQRRVELGAGELGEAVEPEPEEQEQRAEGGRRDGGDAGGAGDQDADRAGSLALLISCVERLGDVVLAQEKRAIRPALRSTLRGPPAR